MRNPDGNFKIPAARALAQLLVFLALFASFPFCTRAADTPTEPPEIYQDIDVRVSNDAIKSLRTEKDKKLETVEKLVMATPENFNPSVLYTLSSVLFNQGKKDEAVFWFYAGQLRGRIDAAICADKSARAAIDTLNQRFGPPINHYALTNISLMTNAIERVLTWEEKTPCHYDRRWINLQGVKAMTGNADKALSAPQNQWEAIRARTRDEYASEFHKALATYLKRKH
jgi:hypothetical protein